MYHDLQKLKSKPQSEFTAQDLNFVKQTVCEDGVCFSGALTQQTSLALAATAVTLVAFLV